MDRSLVKSILQQIIKEDNISENGKGFNFRCVKCGDSKKSKSKKRGWVLFRGDLITYYCFNCNCPPQSFKNFVKEYDSGLFDKHFKNRDVKDILKKNYDVGAKIVIEKKKFEHPEDLSKDILPVSFKLLQKNITGIYKKELQKKAVDMVRKRKIPREYYKDFLVCCDYTDKKLEHFKDRLIIPFYDKTGNLYCFQGRTLNDSVPKYLTWNADNIKIFNFFRVDPTKPVLIFEGPIDAMFLPNSIATCGKISPDSEQYELIKKTFPKRIWAFDNQYCDEAGKERAIIFAEKNEKVFVWPKAWREQKDMNEIILGQKLTSEEVCSIMYKNIYKGFKAKIKLKTI